MAKIARPTKPLADVNVLPQPDGSNKVVACFMPDPDILVPEGQSRAVLALDASLSIKKMFGEPPTVFNPTPSPNYVQMVARKLGAILCGVARSGKVSMIYWAVGANGGEIEQIGEFDEREVASADISGPSTKPGTGKRNWGRGTQILPPIKHMVENVARGSDWTMGVIITDGIIEDEDAAMNYCRQLGKNLLASGKQDQLKLVLIGVGEEIDEGQLERFDDMFEGTELEDQVDLWSHGVAASMREEADIIDVLFGELMTEDIEVAPSGSVLDSQGREIASWADGLPGKITFTLPKGCTSFTVHTPAADVTQDISQAAD